MMSRRSRRLSASLVTLILVTGCTHQIRPRPIVPAPLEGPVDATVLLILTEELEAYESTLQQGYHTYFFHFGEAAAEGMIDVFQNVFSSVRVERDLGLVAATTIISAADSTTATYLAVPRVQARTAPGPLDTDVELDLVVDMVDLSTGQSTFLRSSGKEGFTFSATGSAETALEDALQAIQAQLIAYHRDRRP